MIFSGSRSCSKDTWCNTATDPPGLMSLTRQVVNVLGYEVSNFIHRDGVNEMKIGEMRKGFDEI
jgi:hypothetical protein